MSVSCLLLAACAGGDFPAVSSELAEEIRAAYQTGAATAVGGIGSGGSGGGSRAGAGGVGGRAPAGDAGDGGMGGSDVGPAGAAGGTSAGSAGAAGSGGSAGAANACDGFAILASNCGSSGCHGAGSNLEDFAASETAARSFIGKLGTLACSGQGMVIDPDDPAESLMIRKLSDDPPCGQTMPISTSPLSASEIECIQSWIGGL